MELGLSSLLFVNATIEEAVRATAELNFDCIEIICDVPHFSPDFEPGAVRGLKELIDSHELGVSVHATIWDLNPASHYPVLRELALAQVKKSMDICSILDGSVVVVHPGRCPIPELGTVLDKTKNLYREFIGGCLRYASDRGITLAPENIDSAHYPYSDADELKLLAQNFEGLGITFDIGHAYIAKRRRGVKAPEESIADTIREIGRHLAHVHVHDNKGSWDDHLPPGEGDVNFEPIVEALDAVKYDRLLIAELWDPKNPLETGRRGLRSVQKLFGTHRG